MMSIYNDEPEGGRTYVIDWVSALNVAATAVVGQATIIVNNGMIRVAAPTDSGLLPKKTNGNGSVSNAVVRRQDTKALSIVTGSLNASQGIAHAWVQVGTGVKWDADPQRLADFFLVALGAHGELYPGALDVVKRPSEYSATT